MQNILITGCSSGIGLQTALTLKENNYILIFKPILFDNDRKPKGNVDADLVLQSMIEFNNYSKAIIVSSDGDFYCLVKYLYGNEKLLKVISPDVKNCSKLLKYWAAVFLSPLLIYAAPKLL